MIEVEELLNYSLAELDQMCKHWHKYNIVELVVTDFRRDPLYIKVRKELYCLHYFNVFVIRFHNLDIYLYFYIV